jgi:hypothetical protein
LTLFLLMKKVSVDLFRAAPYMLMLGLHKDALFHYIGTCLILTDKASTIQNIFFQCEFYMGTLS